MEAIRIMNNDHEETCFLISQGPPDWRDSTKFGTCTINTQDRVCWVTAYLGQRERVSERDLGYNILDCMHPHVDINHVNTVQSAFCTRRTAIALYMR